MIKLLVIADDFTGALDTGIQFKAKGTLVRVYTPQNQNIFAGLEQGVQVLISVAETRHMPPAEAGEIVAKIVSQAQQASVSCIYKKIDSALRGNIGSELSAMRAAAHGKQLHFIPAFPKMNRVTVNGIHYIGQVPVADSVFGSDPFEPVRHSNIQNIIGEQSNIPTYLVAAGEDIPDKEGILIYDAVTDEDLLQIAQRLNDCHQLKLLAGCAGLAAVLPKLLNLTQYDCRRPAMNPRLITVCGSINPITIEQLDTAEKNGMHRIRLTPQQKLDPTWLESEDGECVLAQWLNKLQHSTAAIIDCGGPEEAEETRSYALTRDMNIEATRSAIAQSMGRLLERMLEGGLEATLMLTGGDTLLAFMREINQDSLIPVCELVPGVVLSRTEYNGKRIDLISKSGGFGSAELLTDLAKIIAHSGEEELVC